MAKLPDKVALFDSWAETAVADLIDFLRTHEQELIDFARGRHIWGHFHYGDTEMYEWNDGQMRAALVEELADAIVYRAKMLADGVAIMPPCESSPDGSGEPGQPRA